MTGAVILVAPFLALASPVGASTWCDPVVDPSCAWTDDSYAGDPYSTTWYEDPAGYDPYAEDPYANDPSGTWYEDPYVGD
ncbi:MAG: hypothetical protein AAFO29_12990, partial [Actinomycetota bacterium]